MRFARGLLIFTYGLFTIGAQTLLFREFVTAFEGNDISVGVFFGSWFLWIGLGALLPRYARRLADRLLGHVEFLFLLYLPAYLGQLLLIVPVRELAGVASYDLMPVQTLVFWALLVNAPVSFVTGMLFPLACRWIEPSAGVPIGRVYLLEAAGSFAGGLAVTALLACHVPALRVFFLLALVLLLAVGVAGLARPGRAFSLPRLGACAALILAVLAAAVMAAGADAFVTRYLQAAKWSRLLPGETLDGAFTTAQAEYLHGRYRSQWVVVREGSVCEALPNEEDAGRTAALTLCQNPRAQRVLVIGSGLALCRRLLLLPHMEAVAWANADSECTEWLLEHVPAEFGSGDRRLHPVTGDIRRYLDATTAHFDLVIINLPDTASAAFNRYFTVEFYHRINASLRAGGIVGVGIAGHENILGAELAGLGASARQTLAQVFAHLVLVPGDQTWLIASNAAGLTGDPAVLRDRFAAMEGAARVFPPVGLLSVYLPERAAEALRAYDRTDLPPELLVNRDARPLTHLYGLLLAARQSGASLTHVVKLLAVSGWLPFVVPILVFVALRIGAARGRTAGGTASGFDSAFLIFSTGAVGIATMIVLMYAYETHFGSLYLHVGVISSLFMAGLAAGALSSTGILPGDVSDGHGRDAHATETPGGVTASRRLHILLLGILLTHALFLTTAAFWFSRTNAGKWLGQGVFALAFTLSGLCCGAYWPLAAAWLAHERFDSGAAGSRLEAADHFGACLGGLATSLLMVPLLGTRVSLLVLAGLLLANMPAAVLAWWRRPLVMPAGECPRLRPAGYVLLGVVASLVLGSNLLARAATRLQPTLPERVVHALAGEAQARPMSIILQPGGRRATYFVLADAEQKTTGYLFSSVDFAPEVRGFGGRLSLAMHVDAAGTLTGFLLVRSNETPTYLDLLRDWLDSLKGQGLFAPRPFKGIQAVTGATISSQAILDSLQTSGRRFAEQVLGKQSSASSGRRAGSWMQYVPDPTGLYLIAAFLAAVAVARWGGRRSRIAVLTLTLVLGGLVLNAQYSSEQIATLLSFDAPTVHVTGVFLLVVGVPLLVLLFGNLYCGYLCPFGAAQELLGNVLPRRRSVPPRGPLRTARSVKYLILAVLLAAFFLSRDRRTLSSDPLTSVFALRSAFGAWPAALFGVVGAAVIGSLFHIRFWCRHLCPAGAFLSLLSHVGLLRRWMPAPQYGRCEFGLTAADHLDCLCCDRCRHAAVPAQAGPATTEVHTKAQPLIVAVALCGILVAGISWTQFRRALPVLWEESAPVPTAGQPRDVDVQQIRTLIQQRHLSDRKAEYYRPSDGNNEGARGSASGGAKG
ncbi:MAG: 4Fe-4S binding protein [Planctomycetes bacterium]|nr:4Fe-4S binding protein [Planctomycetota bacterium]